MKKGGVKIWCENLEKKRFFSKGKNDFQFGFRSQRVFKEIK